MNWILGLGFSLVVGHFAVDYFLRELRKYMQLGESPALPGGMNRVPPWLTGGLERLFFTLLVAFGVSGTSTAMIGWLALKMAANWNRPEYGDEVKARSFAFSALVAGVLSMLLALLGGLICAS